jgi:hypothetical protein
MALTLDEYFDLCRILAPRIPEMATMLLGILLSMRYWKEYPRPAFLSFMGFCLQLATDLLFSVFYWLNPYETFDFPPTSDPYLIVAAFEAVRSSLSAIGLGLILAAIYSGRKPTPPKIVYLQPAQDATKLA